MIPGFFQPPNPIEDKSLAPFGNSDFAKLVRSHNAGSTVPFVDKTKMIEALLNDNASILLFTRPRRFGKSTNISMFYYFLGVPEARTLFEPLAIGKKSQIMEQHQGAYSVIPISLKSVSALTYEDFISKFKVLLSDLYLSFRFILHDYLNAPENHEEANFFQKIVEMTTDVGLLESSLKKLSQFLFEACKKPVWILIDEYDAPLHHSYSCKYYPQMIDLMRGFLGSALKENPFLHRGIITGILRVAKESLFSALNNIKVDSIFNHDYAPYFGFTPEEVQQLLVESGIIPSATAPIPPQIIQWYNGYIAGNVTLYNPLSIVSYLEGRELKAYWVNTGSDLLIKELLASHLYDFPGQLQKLLLGESIHELISENLEMTSLHEDVAALWSLLVASGYLKIVSFSSDFNELQELAIPNFEVYTSLKQVGKSVLKSPSQDAQWFYKALQGLLVEGKTEAFFEGLERVLQENASFHDLGVKGESFYHGMLLGITATLQSSHKVESNRESGHGRYGLAVIPKPDFPHIQKGKNNKIRAVIFEIKRVPWVKKRSAEEMELLLEETALGALAQVEEKDYLSQFRQTNAQEVIAIGIAFSGKLFYGQAQVYSLL